MSNWAIVVGKVRLNFGCVSFKVNAILVGNPVWKTDFSEYNF